MKLFAQKITNNVLVSTTLQLLNIELYDALLLCLVFRICGATDTVKKVLGLTCEPPLNLLSSDHHHALHAP